MQARALTTYVQRIYFPFLLAEPVRRSGEAATCLLWPHTPFMGPEDSTKGAALGCMAVVPQLASLPLALLDIKKAAASARALSVWLPQMPAACLSYISHVWPVSAQTQRGGSSACGAA